MTAIPSAIRSIVDKRKKGNTNRIPGYGSEIISEFKKSKIGMIGLGILFVLIVVSVLSMVVIPIETFQKWNNPVAWLLNPKAAMPAWVNLFLQEKLPEHMSIDPMDPSEIKKKPIQKKSGGNGIENEDFFSPAISLKNSGLQVISKYYVVDYYFDQFPNDFIYKYSSEYSGSPVLSLSVLRPDGRTMNLMSSSLPAGAKDSGIALPSIYSTNGEEQIANNHMRIGEQTVMWSEDNDQISAVDLKLDSKKREYSDTIFSTDNSLRNNIRQYSDTYDFDTSSLLAEEIVFSKTNQNIVQKGKYVFRVDLYNLKEHDTEFQNSQLIIGGKVYGFLGTDELRRDLLVGVLWGTPLALFIGISVAAGSVMFGLVYGVYSGYRGKKTDETMMRLNDVVYALPVLPLLIILAVTIGKNIFLIVGFLMMFGWVGIAKVSRSMSLQIKNQQYVEAAKTMGQKDHKIIFKHIIPQLLPYAFASIAISVPAAITTEAGLSFLGLGDPTFPTWGHILHDANAHGAATRGLWWWVIPPGIMISLTGLAFVFIGHAMDAIVNPRLKKR